jgi:hypoxanthine phosphoribosyltransferase
MSVADNHMGLTVTWNDLDSLTATLVHYAATDGVPDIVVGITRGGLIPAVLCSHRLGVRDLRTVEITHTTSDGPHAAKYAQPRLANPASIGDIAGRDVLVIDDVAGTGDTLTAAATLLTTARAQRVRTAVCVVNDCNWRRATEQAPQDAIDYIATRTNGWVIFPWETSSPSVHQARTAAPSTPARVRP